MSSNKSYTTKSAYNRYKKGCYNTLGTMFKQDYTAS